MSEVETHAETRLSLIARDDGALPPTGALHDLGVGSVFMQRRVTRGNARGALFQECEEPLLTQQRDLHRFASGGNDLSCWKRAQRLEVGDHGDWLMECADEVLPFREIHAGLPTERCIQLSCERGWDGDPVDAAQVEGGEQARRVGQRATADGNDEIAPLDARRGESACCVVDHRESFCRLAGLEGELGHVDLGALERRDDR